MSIESAKEFAQGHQKTVEVFETAALLALGAIAGVVAARARDKVMNVLKSYDLHDGVEESGHTDGPNDNS